MGWLMTGQLVQVTLRDGREPKNFLYDTTTTSDTNTETDNVTTTTEDEDDGEDEGNDYNAKGK